MYKKTFLLSSLLVLTVAPVCAQEIAGEIVSINGTAFIRQDGRQSEKTPFPAKAGDQVKQGDVINTASNAKVKVMLKDRSIIDIGPSALFKVDQFNKNDGANRQVQVSMMYGTARAAITEKLQGKGKFNFRTPSATMGVRGTEFVVQSEVTDLKAALQAVVNPKADEKKDNKKDNKATETKITVVQGKVEVAKGDPDRKPASGESPKTVALEAGQQLVAKEDTKLPEKPVQLDTKQLQAVTETAKVDDSTFKNAVEIKLDSSGGDGGLGASTMEALSSVVSVPTTAPVSMADMGFAGTFNATTIIEAPRQAAAPVVSNIKQVRVVISR